VQDQCEHPGPLHRLCAGSGGEITPTMLVFSARSERYVAFG